MNKLNIGFSISIEDPDYNIPEYINSIQFMFNINKLSIGELNTVKKIISNNKHIKNIFVHSSYKINIGSDFIINNNGFYSNSYELLEKEVEYMHKLKINNIILHTGKNKKGLINYEHVLNNMKNFIKYCLKNIDINIILETSSGQGNETLYDLIEFVNFIQSFEDNINYDKLFVCVDTCHIFQAGYDINKNSVIKEVHKILSPIKDKIKLIHLNSSVYKVGSKIDRHANIGEGYIKTEKLKKFVKEYKNVPLILETSEPFEEQVKLLE